MIKIGGVVYRNIQEQVAKNTQDIAKIQRRPVLQVKKVDELPEQGEEGILYLLPASDPETGNYFEEYLWIDSAWELIGSSAVDISNMCTTDTDQTISGQKTFTQPIVVGNGLIEGSAYYVVVRNNINGSWVNAVSFGTEQNFSYKKLLPNTTGSLDLGSSSNKWKDLYLSDSVNIAAAGSIKLDDDFIIKTTANNFILAIQNGSGSNLYNFSSLDFTPQLSNIRDLGSTNAKWKNLYLGGNITDGTNSVSVADLAALITYAKAQGWIS